MGIEIVRVNVSERRAGVEALSAILSSGIDIESTTESDLEVALLSDGEGILRGVSLETKKD